METVISSRAWKVIVGGLALELLIAAIAIWVKATGTCGSCGSSSPVGVVIGGAGALFYLILLAVALWTGPVRILFFGILVGFAIHAALMILMVSGGPICPPCVFAFAVSAVLFVTSVVHDRATLRRAAVVLPLAAALFQVGGFVFGLVRSNSLAEAHADVTPEVARRDGRARIVVFEDPHCPYCKLLERDVLPAIEKEFESRIRVVRRSGSDVPGLPLPTVIVIGREEEVFEGLPGRDLLRAAVLRALASLEASRVPTSLSQNP